MKRDTYVSKHIFVRAGGRTYPHIHRSWHPKGAHTYAHIHQNPSKTHRTYITPSKPQISDISPHPHIHRIWHPKGAHTYAHIHQNPSKMHRTYMKRDTYVSKHIFVRAGGRTYPHIHRSWHPKGAHTYAHIHQNPSKTHRTYITPSKPQISDISPHPHIHSIFAPNRLATSLLSTLTTFAANYACAPAIYVCAVSVRRMGTSK